MNSKIWVLPLLLLSFIASSFSLTLNQSISIELIPSGNFSYQSSLEILEFYPQPLFVVSVDSYDDSGWKFIKVSIQTDDQMIVNQCTGTLSVSCQILKITQAKNFKIMIESSQEGRFNLSAFSSNYSIFQEEEQRIVLSNSVVFYEVKLSQQSFEEMRMEIVPENPSHNPNIFLIKKNSYENLKGVNLWQGRQGIFIEKSKLMQKWMNSDESSILVKINGKKNESVVFKVELLTKSHHDIQLPEDIDDFIAPSTSKDYHLTVPPLQENQALILKISQYSGILNIDIFLDDSMAQRYTTKNLVYRGDSKMVFTKKQIQDNKIQSLFLRARANDHAAVFRISAFIESDGLTINLEQHEYNFISLGKQVKRYTYFIVPQKQGSDFGQQIKGQIAITSNTGIPQVWLYQVEDIKMVECLPECSNSLGETLKVNISSVSLKTIYNFAFQNRKDKENIFVCSIENKNQGNQPQHLIIQYDLTQRIRSLRENTPLEAEVMSQEKKIYQFIPLSSVQLVKICYTEITNQLGILGCTKDPFDANSDWRTPNFQDHCVHFEKPISSHPLYLSVYGQIRSKYVINVQVIHESSILDLQTIEILPGVEYDHKIDPLGSIIFSTEPIEKIQMFYNCSMGVQICISQDEIICSIQNQQESKAGSIDFDTEDKTKHLMMLKNPSLHETLTCKVKYQAQAAAKCEIKKFGILYEQDVTPGKICFKYSLPSLDQVGEWKEQNKLPIQVMVKSKGIKKSNVSISVCGNIFVEESQSEIIQVANDMLYTCEKSKGFQPIMKILLLNPDSESSKKVQYIVQYQSNLMILPQDIEYSEKQIIRGGVALRNYYYSQSLATSKFTYITIKNDSPFNLILSAYITTSLPQKTLTSKQIKPLPHSFMIKSTENNREQMLIIDNTMKRCEQLISGRRNSSRCLLVIAVEAEQSEKKQGEKVKYSIQVRHQDKILKQFEAVNSVIEEVGDINVFRFYPVNILDSNDNQTHLSALFKLSTKNQQCAHISVLSLDSRSSSPHQSSIQANTQVVSFDLLDSPAYAVQISATQAHCHYSLQVICFRQGESQTNHTHISGFINENQQSSIFLAQKDEIEYFIAEFSELEDNDTQFGSILFIRKYGAVDMFAVEATPQNLNKILNHEGYLFSEMDFPHFQQLPNILKIEYSAGKENFIVAVRSQQKCEGNLIVHQANREIKLPIYESILLPLQPRESVSIYFYHNNFETDSFGLKTYLFYGDIKMKTALVDSSSNIYPFSKFDCCQPNEEKQFTFSLSELFNPQQNITIQSTKYILVKIQNSEDIDSLLDLKMHTQNKELTLFSSSDLQHLRLLTLKNNEVLPIKVKALSSDFRLLISVDQIQEHNSTTGFIRSQDSNTSNIYQSYLQCLVIASENTANHLPISVYQYIIQDSILQVNFELKEYEGSGESVEMIVHINLDPVCNAKEGRISISSDKLSDTRLLEEWKWTFVEDNKQFIIATKQEFLIDFSVCSDDFDVALVGNYSQLKSLQKSHHLISKNEYSLPDFPHVLKFRPTTPLSYLYVRSPKAVMRLIIPNQQQQIGIGYYKYSWQGFSYTTDLNKLTINLGQIKSKKPTKTHIGQIIYKVELLTKIDPKIYSLKCDDSTATKIFDKLIYSSSEFVMSKDDILELLGGQPQNIYLSVDVTMILLSNSSDAQIYKLKSPIQQISKDIFLKTKFTYQELALWVFFLIIISAGLIAIAFFFLKVIVPWRSRKNVQFAEQEKPDPSNQMQAIPASSDRNARLSSLNSDRQQIDSEINSGKMGGGDKRGVQESQEKMN